MGYEVTMTKTGYELQAKLFAEGGSFPITRVEVGKGVCPVGTDPARLTGLVEPVAPATYTTPRREGCEVSLTVEYRSDLGGGLEEPFQIREFGVFAAGADGVEFLLLYGDLSDYPESVVPQKYGGCVRRYPVKIVIGPDARVEWAYPAGAWVIHEELAQAISDHDGDPNAHPYLLGLCAGMDARLALLELMYATDVSGNPFTVTFETLDGVETAGVWNQHQARIEF